VERSRRGRGGVEDRSRRGRGGVEDRSRRGRREVEERRGGRLAELLGCAPRPARRAHERTRQLALSQDHIALSGGLALAGARARALALAGGIDRRTSRIHTAPPPQGVQPLRSRDSYRPLFSRERALHRARRRINHLFSGAALPQRARRIGEKRPLGAICVAFSCPRSCRAIAPARGPTIY